MFYNINIEHIRYFLLKGEYKMVSKKLCGKQNKSSLLIPRKMLKALKIDYDGMVNIILKENEIVISKKDV